MGFIPDDFSMVCLPPCAENQYYDFFETHECVLCDTVIENCDRCHLDPNYFSGYSNWINKQETLYPICTECVEEFSPSQYGNKCTLCEVNEYLNPNPDIGCKKCSDHVQHLGRCDFYLDFAPLQCYNNILLSEDYYGNPICECDSVSYMKIDPTDETAAKCEFCYQAIPNCSECDVVNGQVMCTDCTNGYYLNSLGKCVLSSCGAFNSDNICTTCNERDGIQWLLQSHQCVAQC